MRTSSCILAMALAGASPAWAQKVTNPDWAEKPSGEALAESFPKLASMLGVDGMVVVSCLVTAKGATDDCRAVYESPAGLGFADAALGMAKTFKMKPKTIDGRPVDGGSVRFPLHFRLPAQPASKKVSETIAGSEVFGPPTAKALELAGKIVGDQDTSRKARLQFEIDLMPLIDAKWPGVDEKTRDDGVESLRAGLNAYLVELEAAMARAYAANFSEQELADIEAFTSTPSGQAFLARLSKVSQEVRPPKDAAKVILEASRAAFCARHACVAEPPPAGLPDPHVTPPPTP